MARTLLVVDPDVGVSPVGLAQAWEAEPGPGGGAASVEAARGRAMLPGVLLPRVLEVLVLPVAVNLASGALVELVRRLVGRARGPGGGADFEVVETTDDRGERVAVVHARRRP